MPALQDALSVGSFAVELGVSHASADADALGALVAVSLLRPGARLYVPEGLDAVARALAADFSEAVPELLSDADVRQLLGSVEGSAALWVVDTARAERLGVLAQQLHDFASVWAIDTHPPTDDDLPRVSVPVAASCTAVLVEALVARGCQPGAEAATVMLVAIHVDTGHFTFPATSAVDHAAAATLLSWGADSDAPRRYSPRGHTVAELKLLEQLAAGVRHVRPAGVSVALLTLELDHYVSELGALLTSLREAEQWPAAVLVAAAGGRVWVIVRTDGSVDAAAVCAALGGGGHGAAGSASLSGLGLSEVVQVVHDTLRSVLGAGRRARDLMVRPFVAVPADMSVSEVAGVLHRHRINGVPVYEDGDEDGVLVGRTYPGQVSRQEVDAAMRHRLKDAPVWQISAGPPGWVPSNATLDVVRDTLLRGRGRIWLVGDPESSEPPGLITRTTVLRAAAEPALAAGRKLPARHVVRGRLRRALGKRWAAVKALGELAAQSHQTAWLVGGGVRDLLLDRPVRDADVVVEGDAVALAKRAVEALGGRSTHHPAFGTAKWDPLDGVSGHEAVDIAGARGEHYPARAALPVVDQAALTRDLFRRDFTVNAMAVCLHPDRVGQVLDPYGGWPDLKSRTLRVLHGLSFHDDPTRAIRGARFAARFGLKLAPGTRGLVTAARQSGVFEELSRDRRGAELDRLLDEPDSLAALRCLHGWGLLDLLHPSLRLDTSTRAVLPAVLEARAAASTVVSPTPTRSDVAWLALCCGLSRPDRAQLSELVPGVQARRDRVKAGLQPIRRALQAMLGSSRRSSVGLALRSLDGVQWVVALGLASQFADEDVLRERLWWWWRDGRHQKPLVTGHELQAAGHRPGPRFKLALQAALCAAWDGHDQEGQLAAAVAALGDVPA